MRILYFGNNSLGCKVLRWLKQRGEEIVGLVAHPPGPARKFGDELLDAAGLPNGRVFDGAQLREDNVLGAIRSLNADVGLSVFFGYILRRELIDLLPFGCINLHSAMLPYNRGAHPNVWSIVEGTTAGATLHYVDEGVDTGDIIAQKAVSIEPVDTGATLYRKLEEACFQLFCESWPAIKAGAAPRLPQPKQNGTTHRASDLRRIEEIDLNRSYRAGELLDILRARTFPPYEGAYFIRDGRKVHVNVHLQYGDET